VERRRVTVGQSKSGKTRPGVEVALKAVIGSNGVRNDSTRRYLTEPPDADPHVRWCGRGAVRPSPYPDSDLSLRTSEAPVHLFVFREAGCFETVRCRYLIAPLLIILLYYWLA
jgi:hypothetical protein